MSDDARYILYFNGYGMVRPVGDYDTSREAMESAGIGKPIKWIHTPEWSDGKAWLGIPFDGAPDAQFTYSVFYESPEVGQALQRPTRPSPPPAEYPPDYGICGPLSCIFLAIALFAVLWMTFFVVFLLLGHPIT